MAANEPSAPGDLVIVTGSSHAGKSTLIRELLARIDRPAATVSIDETIAGIDLPEPDLWDQGLPSAYTVAAGEAEELLMQGALVFFESTFTYIPPQPRRPEFHETQLRRLVDASERLGGNTAVLQLVATREDLIARLQASGRLPAAIVLETWRIHAQASFPAPKFLRLDSSQHSAGVLADLTLRSLSFLSPP
jgi:chloramphenicol 3-O-phosphotransferase